MGVIGTQDLQLHNLFPPPQFLLNVLDDTSTRKSSRPSQKREIF